MPSPTTRVEIVRLIAQMSLGTGALAVIGGTVVDHRLPHAVGRRDHRRTGLQLPGRHRRRGAHRLHLGLRQRPHHRAGGRRHRAGRHHRRGCDRPAGRDADQRGDRRAGGDGHPLDRLPGVHPRDRRGHRRHPAVLHRGTRIVLRRPDGHHVRLRAVHRCLRPLLQHLPALHRPDLVVLPGGDDRRSW